MSELKVNNTSQGQSVESVQLTAHDPKDFEEGGSEHRRALLANGSLIVVLLLASKLEPEVLGIEVSVPVLWLLIGVAHIYFFTMWRLTAPVEADTKKQFWNVRGLYKQAILGGTKGFPGKTKAQLVFIRALPIWVFLLGILGVMYGLCAYVRA
jgi:hypothetical protein